MALKEDKRRTGPSPLESAIKSEAKRRLHGVIGKRHLQAFKKMLPVV